MLEKLANGLWVKAQQLRFFGVETGSRMTVVQLRDGGLFVHSPIPLTAPLQAEIDALGPVKAVVAPSLFHHLSVGEWQTTYPDAVICACPGLEKKRKDLAWDRVLGDQAEPEWEGDLEQVFFGARALENEVVFYHPASRTMICADCIFHFSSHPSLLTRTVGFLMGNRKPGATLLERIMIKDRAIAREQIGRMLAWDIERIILSHGQIIETEGHEVLRRAYQWL